MMHATDHLLDLDRLHDRAHRLAPRLRAEAIDQFWHRCHALLRGSLSPARTLRRAPRPDLPAAACH